MDTYEKPTIEIIEIKIEGSIVQASSDPILYLNDDTIDPSLDNL